jgi:drug/metabolite transporter (DMT)-like permease
VGLPEALALAAAFGFAGTAVTARLGLRDTSVVAGILVSNAVSTIVLLVAVWVDPPQSVPPSAAGWFAVAGVLGGSGLAAAAILIGIARLGPPTHGPLQGGAYGITISLGAALFLGEAVGPLRAVGVAAIVIGGGRLVQLQSIIAAPAPAAGPPPAAPPGAPPRTGTLQALQAGAIFPLLAGSSLAASDLIVKENLGTLAHPTFAAAVVLLAGLLLWAAIVLLVPAVRRSLRIGSGAVWFLASGALLGAAFAALTTALTHADASTVGPIVACEPLAVILLSALFLSGLSRVTREMVAASCLVVAGAILVSL